jgi:hypothetical protein
MEKMEGKTTPEMVNENSGWLIVEFKTFPFTTFFIWCRDSMEKIEGKTPQMAYGRV